MRQPRDGIDQIAWLPVHNGSGETIPAFAAMRISGLQTTGEFTVAKPNTNDAVNNIIFNGPCEIPNGLKGIATADMPAAVRYDTADGTPVNGDEWGVAASDWKLRNARSGFLIQGVMDATVGIASAVRNLATAGGTELKGLTFTSDTGSTADSDPGNGLFKWNNATQSSATVLYFDNQTADSQVVSSFWAALGQTGFIYLQQGDDSTKWQKWQWTETIAASGYYKFTVTHLASNGTIADDKTVYTIFDSSQPAWGTPVPGGPPLWVKVSKTYSDWSDAGSVKTINLYTLPAEATLLMSGIDHRVAWTGGEPNGLTLELQDSLGSAATYAAAYLDLRSAPPTTLFNAAFIYNGAFAIASNTVQGRLTIAGGGALNSLTAGTVDFYFLIGRLP